MFFISSVIYLLFKTIVTSSPSYLQGISSSAVPISLSGEINVRFPGVNLNKILLYFLSIMISVILKADSRSDFNTWNVND